MIKSYLLCLLLFGFFSGCAVQPTPIRDGSRQLSSVEYSAVKYSAQAQKYFKRGRFVDAEQYYRLARYLAPREASLNIALAATLTKQGLYEEAGAIYSDLLGRLPNNIKIRLGYAKQLVAMGQYGNARKVYRDALKLVETKDISPQSEVDSHQKRTSLLPKQLAARLRYQEVIHRSLATMEFQIGNEEQAMCESFTSLQVGVNSDALLRHVKLLLAIGEFQRVVDLVPLAGAKPELLGHLALAAFSTAGCEDAVKVSRRILERKKSPPEATLRAVWVQALCEKDDEWPSSNDEEQLEEYFSELPAFLIEDNPSLLYMPEEFLREAEVLEERRPVDVDGSILNASVR